MEYWGVIWSPREVLAVMSPFFSLLWFCNYIIINTYIVFLNPNICWDLSYSFLPVSLWCLWLSFCCVLRHYFVICHVAYLYPCSPWRSYGRVLMSYHNVKHTILVIIFFIFMILPFLAYSVISMICSIGLYCWPLPKLCWAKADSSLLNLLFLMCYLWLC
jgi:hypothetical protein